MSDAIVRAFAPGSIGNFGPGLDILGAAVTGAGDSVVAEWSDAPGITLLDAGHGELPNDAMGHTAGIAAGEVMRMARRDGASPQAAGITLTARKGLPLAAGQGGSAASAVAGAVAANVMLGQPLDAVRLLEACLVAEERVAGRHLDNLAACLLGGIVLVRSLDPIDVIALPVPESLTIVLAHPDQRLRTADARAVLPSTLERSLALHQAAQIAAMVAALASGDLALLGRALDDRIAEPARAPLLPGFREAKRAALAAGALGASISGAGPTAFAIADGETNALAIAGAMRLAYERAGLRCDARVARIDRRGAFAEPVGAGDSAAAR